MPITPQAMEDILSATLDLHIKKGTILDQHIQNKPLLQALKGRQKTYAGAGEYITRRVNFTTSTSGQWFAGDDVVNYGNPTGIKTLKFLRGNLHAGIQVTHDELDHNGIEVTETNGARVAMRSDREAVALADLLEYKLNDMSEGMSDTMNATFWGDGTQNAKAFPGITGFVVDNPAAAAVVAGIDQAAVPRWRNRAATGIVATAANADTQVLTKKLNSEHRQLTRFGGKPTHFFAGSDFLDQMENELRAKGYYTQGGWASRGSIDMGASDPAMKGITLEYDPWLDDNSKAKYGYWLDLNAMRPMVLAGEDMKKHTPSRPYDRYVMFRSVTWKGAFVIERRNSSGVYSIA